MTSEPSTPMNFVNQQSCTVCVDVCSVTAPQRFYLLHNAHPLSSVFLLIPVCFCSAWWTDIMLQVFTPHYTARIKCLLNSQHYAQISSTVLGLEPSLSRVKYSNPAGRTIRLDAPIYKDVMDYMAGSQIFCAF